MTMPEEASPRPQPVPWYVLLNQVFPVRGSSIGRFLYVLRLPRRPPHLVFPA